MNPGFWNERFAAEGYAYGSEPNDFIRAEAHRIPLVEQGKGRVLCLAEGQGRNAVYLAGLGHAVTAVDFSVEGLKKAEQLAKARGVTLDLVQADLSEYTPPEDTFTGVVSVFAHLPREIRRRVHGCVARALVPGGVFLLEAYSPAQLAHGTGGPKDVALLMSLADLREELAPLDLVVAREVERDIQEGAFHGGPSATVQIAAQRRA
jgi:SAM-dependent methyltransferase